MWFFTENFKPARLVDAETFFKLNLYSKWRWLPLKYHILNDIDMQNQFIVFCNNTDGRFALNRSQTSIYFENKNDLLHYKLAFN